MGHPEWLLTYWEPKEDRLRFIPFEHEDSAMERVLALSLDNVNDRRAITYTVWQENNVRFQGTHVPVITDKYVDWSND